MTTETKTEQAATTNEGQGTSTTGASEPNQGGSLLTNSQTPNEQQASQGHANTGEGEQAGEGDAGESDKKSGAPEKYEFKAPEGREFDAQVIEKFSDVAKELNLPQDAAQKILDQVAPVIQARQVEAIQATVKGWGEASRNDKEFGGEKLNENLTVAKKALDTFGTPELRTLLNETSLGNHPEMIRFMYRAGKGIGEDHFVAGQGGQTKQKDARNLYAASNMNP